MCTSLCLVLRPAKAEGAVACKLHIDAQCASVLPERLFWLHSGNASDQECRLTCKDRQVDWSMETDKDPIQALVLSSSK